MTANATVLGVIAIKAPAPLIVLVLGAFAINLNVPKTVVAVLVDVINPAVRRIATVRVETVARPPIM